MTPEEHIAEQRYKHQCLVRWVLKMRVRDRNEAHRFLNGWHDQNGRWVTGWNQRHPKSTLEADLRDQWAKGNRGAKDDWR